MRRPPGRPNGESIERQPQGSPVTLQGKTLFISGASRGIGLAIATRCSADGANVAIAARTPEANPRLPGTIYTAAKQIEAAGGRCLPLQVDIREEAQVVEAARKTAETFGGIDIVINNASAIKLIPTEATPIKRFDLMFGAMSRRSLELSAAARPSRCLSPASSTPTAPTT